MTHTITKHLAALAAVLLPATGMADDLYADGLYYDITGETTVEVAEVPYLSGPPTGDVVIPATVEYNDKTYRVTAIGDEAFEGNGYLTSVSIPESVTAIGYRAFSECTSLTTIDIPGSVTTLGNECFQECEALSTVTLHEGLTSIGNRCFFIVATP